MNRSGSAVRRRFQPMLIGQVKRGAGRRWQWPRPALPSTSNMIAVTSPARSFSHQRRRVFHPSFPPLSPSSHPSLTLLSPFSLSLSPPPSPRLHTQTYTHTHKEMIPIYEPAEFTWPAPWNPVAGKWLQLDPIMNDWSDIPPWIQPISNWNRWDWFELIGRVKAQPKKLKPNEGIQPTANWRATSLKVNGRKPSRGERSRSNPIVNCSPSRLGLELSSVRIIGRQSVDVDWIDRAKEHGELLPDYWNGCIQLCFWWMRGPSSLFPPPLSPFQIRYNK